MLLIAADAMRRVPWGPEGDSQYSVLSQFAQDMRTHFLCETFTSRYYSVGYFDDLCEFNVPSSATCVVNRERF
jgi:hypothetical protein